MAETTIDSLSPAELSLLAIVIRNQITPSGVARDWNDIKNFGHIAAVWRSRTDSQDTDEQVRELGYGVMRQAIKMGLLQKDKGGQESWVEDVSGCTTGRDLRDALASRATKSNAKAGGGDTKGKGKARADKNAQATTQQQPTSTSSNRPRGAAGKQPRTAASPVDSTAQGVKKSKAGPEMPSSSSNKDETSPAGPHGAVQPAQDIRAWLKIYPADGAAASKAESSGATSGGSNPSTKVSQNLKEQAQLLGLVAMGKLGPDGQQRLKKLQEEYQAAMKGTADGAGEVSL